MVGYYRSLLLIATSLQATSASDCDFASLGVSDIVTPTDPTYDEAKSQYASFMSTKKVIEKHISPTAIVFCENDDDVLKTISFSSRCSYSLSIRSGGHQYGGFSSCKGGTKCIQLDVSRIQTFHHEEDGDIVTLGPGNNISMMTSKLVPLGLTLPTGNCNGVSAGGHFQSSSVGMWIRPFGLGMDHVKSFRLATADAKILEVSKESNKQLYDAVLGGGPGSFGVVLDYKIKAIRGSDYPDATFIVYSWTYEKELHLKLANLFMEISDLPEYERDLIAFMTVTPDIKNKSHVLRVTLIYVGRDNGPLHESGNYEKVYAPFESISNPKILLNVTDSLEKIWNINRFDWDFRPLRYHIDHLMSDSLFKPDFMGVITDEIETYLSMPGVYISSQYQILGGSGKGSQYNRNVGFNGFPHRGLKINWDFWVFFETDEQGEAVVTQIKDFRERRKDMVMGMSVIEKMYITTDTVTADHSSLSEVWPKYYPTEEFYRGLQKVKKDVDPTDLFHTDMTVTLPDAEGNPEL